MPEEKETIGTKTSKALQKYAVTLVIGAALFVWTFVKDTFATGAEVKTRELVINIVVSDATVEKQMRKIAQEEIIATMNDAATWLTVLDNEFLKGYTEKKVDDVKADIDRKLAQIDSAQHNLINDIGKAAGIRNDEFVKIFSSMIREYKKDHVTIVHVDPF